MINNNKITNNCTRFLNNVFYLFFIVFIFITCSLRKQNDLQPAEYPVFSVESHRGGRGVMPENTIPAMLYSLSLDGVTTLEFDIHVTSDEKLVLSHDPYLNPLFTLKSNGAEIKESEKKNYPIYQMSYEEIRKFNVGSKVNPDFPGQRKIKTFIPLLDDVIDSVQNFIKINNREQVFYNIETKSSESKDNILNAEPGQFVKLLMNILHKKEIIPYVIIQSFDVRTLQILHKDYPYIRTSYLLNKERANKFTLEENLDLLGFKPDIYSPHYTSITKEDVEKCHKEGIRVVVGTPNTKEEFDELKKIGVDGIITDYPEMLLP